MRELRIAASKAVTEAAEEAGMTEAEWLAVEEGRRTPTLRALLGMANALGIRAGDLLGGGGDRPISPPAEQAAALFEQCPADVQESILNLLRGFMEGSGRKKR